MSRFDEGRARVEQLCEEFGALPAAAMNEAATRLRFVDTLLFECLDWDRSTQVSVETYDGNGDYSDYLLQPDGLAMAVVEAKKKGIYFELPVEQKPTSRVRKLAAVRGLNGQISAAVEQCAAYALSESAPIGVVCNGWQLIIFWLRQPVGVRWRDGSALVFDSLNDMLQGFDELWEALSVTAVRALNLSDRIGKRLDGPPPPKKSASIKNYHGLKLRNDLQAELHLLADLVFGDAIFEDRQLFHEHCYCEAGALPQNRKMARDYYRQLYPEKFGQTTKAPTLKPARTKKGVADELKRPAASKKPVLVLGDVGVGKSTFIENLFLREINDPQMVVLRLDLSDKPSSPADLPAFTVAEITRSLASRYDIDIQSDKFLRGVYHGELLKLAASPIGRLKEADPTAYLKAEIAKLDELAAQPDRHLQSIFAHLKRGQGRDVAIVFDNVDQRADMQDAAFVLAQVAASTWDVFTLVTLRPSTFSRSGDSSPVRGYHPIGFTVYPPRFEKMLDLRLGTAIRMLRGELPMPLGENARAQVATVADYLEILRSSFGQNPDLAEFCATISNGNMREALGYLTTFLSCGHVDAEKILRNWRDTGSYTIPLHEFAKAVMLSDREHYAGDISTVTNIFDYGSSDDRELFLVLTALTILSDLHRADTFCSLAVLRGRMAEAGFSSTQAQTALRRCVDAALVETADKAGTLDEGIEFRPTPRGQYYATKLVRTFVYIDAICIDTPVVGVDALRALPDVSNLTGRTERARSFAAYLGKMFARFPEVALLVRGDQLVKDIEEDIERALGSAYRRASKTKRNSS